LLSKYLARFFHELKVSRSWSFELRKKQKNTRQKRLIEKIETNGKK
jgi:hypothetical protein